MTKKILDPKVSAFDPKIGSNLSPAGFNETAEWPAS